MKKIIEPAHLIRLAAVASVIVAIVLIIIKALAWWVSGSVSLLAGLIDSLLDSFTSFLNLIAVIVALKPADANHKYGHGKAEALAGLAQAIFIAASAVFIAWQGIDKLLHPAPLKSTAWGIVVIIISLIITCGLLGLQKYVVHKTGSTAIAADSLHYRSDVLLNISILLALILSHWGWQYSDALFGIFIAIYILWSAFLVGNEAIAILMDKELSDDITQHIRAIVQNNPNVIGIHDMRTRRSGALWFVQLHVELPAAISLEEAHRYCVAIREDLQKQWPQLDVIVHADPR